MAGAIAFVPVFFLVSFVVVLVVSVVATPADGQVDLLTNWRGWIGLGLGLLAGVQSWNGSVNRDG